MELGGRFGYFKFKCFLRLGVGNSGLPPNCCGQSPQNSESYEMGFQPVLCSAKQIGRNRSIPEKQGLRIRTDLGEKSMQTGYTCS